MLLDDLQHIIDHHLDEDDKPDTNRGLNYNAEYGADNIILGILGTTKTTPAGTTTTPRPTTTTSIGPLQWDNVQSVVELLALLNTGNGTGGNEDDTDDDRCIFCRFEWLLMEYQGQINQSSPSLQDCLSPNNRLPIPEHLLEDIPVIIKPIPVSR